MFTNTWPLFSCSSRFLYIKKEPSLKSLQTPKLVFAGRNTRQYHSTRRRKKIIHNETTFSSCWEFRELIFTALVLFQSPPLPPRLSIEFRLWLALSRFVKFTYHSLSGSWWILRLSTLLNNVLECQEKGRTGRAVQQKKRENTELASQFERLLALEDLQKLPTFFPVFKQHAEVPAVFFAPFLFFFGRTVHQTNNTISNWKLGALHVKMIGVNH